MTEDLSRLPLMPLPAVLFPEAVRSLRLYEPRYLRMVRDCAAAQGGFGVVCFTPATDQAPATHAVIGTEAVIEDFATLEDGLLGITVRGRRRFRVRATTAADDGLLTARVEWIAAEPARPVPIRHAALQQLARELQRHAVWSDLDPLRLEDASGLGMALSSALSLPPDVAQTLLAIHDPEARLDVLLDLLGDDSAG
ncbi:MAG: LON peptidase substrate-binding domain-containing protein [Wenzhouxiangellaceae bacterium]